MSGNVPRERARLVEPDGSDVEPEQAQEPAAQVGEVHERGRWPGDLGDKAREQAGDPGQDGREQDRPFAHDGGERAEVVAVGVGVLAEPRHVSRPRVADGGEDEPSREPLLRQFAGRGVGLDPQRPHMLALPRPRQTGGDGGAAGLGNVEGEQRGADDGHG